MIAGAEAVKCQCERIVGEVKDQSPGTGMLGMRIECVDVGFGRKHRGFEASLSKRTSCAVGRSSSSALRGKWLCEPSIPSQQFVRESR